MEIIIKIDDQEITSLKEHYVKSEEIDLSNVSPYARFFGKACPYWKNDSEYNLMFLRIAQERFNGLLKSRGYLFLNEVYQELGIPHSKAGQVVGWIYNKENPIGDNCVDFRLYDERNIDFINGLRNWAILDFNVDGCILDKIEL